MDTTFHSALSIIENGSMNDNDKFKLKEYLNRNSDKAQSIIDANNRFKNDPNNLNNFFHQIIKQDQSKPQQYQQSSSSLSSSSSAPSGEEFNNNQPQSQYKDQPQSQYKDQPQSQYKDQPQPTTSKNNYNQPQQFSNPQQYDNSQQQPPLTTNDKNQQQYSDTQQQPSTNRNDSNNNNNNNNYNNNNNINNNNNQQYEGDRNVDDENYNSDVQNNNQQNEGGRIPKQSQNQHKCGYGGHQQQHQQQHQQRQQQEQYSYQTRPDVRDDNNPNENNDGVNIFKNENDVNPIMTFDPFIDWMAVKHNLNLHSGWLKRKGDSTNRRVRTPFPPGDYALIDAIPESKKIRVVFSSFVNNYWDSDRRITLNHSDNPDEIRKKIQSAFKFDRRHFSLYQLIESGSHNKVHNLEYNELDENKTYELIIPWLPKLSKKKEQIANKDEKGVDNGDTSTKKVNGNVTNYKKSSSSGHEKRDLCTIN
ncbi:hypothetical protein RB653_000900 [Dictyostelium firmibasis]|uniref:Uncharacterized protein n=1 Tax=Dictyostelium firmibasis TaxID=79012 RepID=A0AAN7YUS0_9MYCE